MTTITHSDLITRRDNGELVPNETYAITDYTNFTIYISAVNERELKDVATDTNNRIIIYDLDTNTITYMQDPVNRIEGYFDWSGNVDGSCSNVFLENATGLNIVSGSRDIFVEDTATGTLTRCSGVEIGDGCTVTLNRCGQITMGRDNTVVMDSCSHMDIGDGNTLDMSGVDGVSIGDNNEDITVVNGHHKIGSMNRAITLDGDSNIVRHNNIDNTIAGICNEVTESRYITANGSFNRVEKTSLVNLDVSCANTLDCAGALQVQYTNNSTVQAADMEIDHRTPFVKYSEQGGVIRVTDLARPVNMQADSQANVVIVDEQKIWMTSDTKADRHYVLVDGVWTNINE